MHINVWARSTATRWRPKAITQRCPTDSTTTSAMQQGACGVHKLKLLGKQKAAARRAETEPFPHSHEQDSVQ